MNHVQSMMLGKRMPNPSRYGDRSSVSILPGPGLAYACRACYSKPEKGAANAAPPLASITGDARRSIGLTPHDVSVVVKTVRLSDYFLLK